MVRGSRNAATREGRERRMMGGRMMAVAMSAAPFPDSECGGRLGDGDGQYPLRDQHRWGHARVYERSCSGTLPQPHFDRSAIQSFGVMITIYHYPREPSPH